MPRKVAPSLSPSSGKFRKSLTRTTVIQILLLALLPVILVSITTIILTRRLITNQLVQQFETVSINYSEQFTEFLTARTQIMNTLKADKAFTASVDTFISDTQDLNEIGLARTNILTTIARQNLTTIQERAFDNVIIVKPNGDVILSTDPTWVGQNLSDNLTIQRLIGTNNALLTHNLAPFYNNKTVLITSRLFVGNDLTQVVTIMGFTPSTLPSDLLANTAAYFPTGQAYLYTSDKHFITFDKFLNQPTEIELDGANQANIDSLTLQTALNKTTDTQSVAGLNVINYTYYLSSLNTHLLFQVPQRIYLTQLEELLRLNLLITGIALLVLGALVYIGTRRLVRPLVNLADISQAFARGDWSQRAVVKRTDEIGLLASSFNQMVEQLTDVYRSLEVKVEERTQQLRTASEVAQIATSTSVRETMAQRTAQLITERFGYNYAAIFLLDETGNYATIRGISGSIGQISGLVNHRVILATHPQLQAVVANDQPLVTNEVDRSEMITQNVLLMSDSQSQVLIPIAVNDQVLGVIDVQSKEPRKFDPDTVNVFQTLANQIATGLRNIILLESTQVNLEETNLVYRASRQITQSSDSNAVFEILGDTLANTNYVSLVLDVVDDRFIVRALKDKRGTRMDVGTVGISLPMQRGQERLAENRPILADNLMAPSEFASVMNFFLRRDCKSAAIIPITVEGKPDKAIAIGSRETSPINNTSLQPFASLAEIVSNTLSRFQVSKALEIRLNELELLAAISDVISSESDLHNLFRTLQQQFTQRLGSDLGFIIALYDSKNQMISIPYAFEEGQELEGIPAFPYGEGFTSQLIRSREPLLLTTNIEQAKALYGQKTHGKSARSWMGTPLMVGGDVYGAIMLQDNENEGRFNNDDLHLLVNVASPIANAIRNAQLVNDLQKNLSAFEQEHYLLNTLLENIPEQVYIKDSRGKYLRVSKSYANAAGIPAQLFLDRTEVDIKGEDAAQIMQDEEELLLAHKSEIGRLIQVTQADGTEMWTLNSRIPLTDSEGEIYGLFGITQDVTELKMTEQLAQRRADQLKTAAAVARDTAGTLEMEELLRNSVNVIRDRYGFYHAGIFLLDPSGEYALLKEATGEAGAKMKEAEHKLSVGSLSVVGRTAKTRIPVVSNDVRKEISYFANPMLPNTRSEVGIPLVAGDELLGVLDVQSEKVDAFMEEDTSILQTVADQLSIALMNARLYAQTQEHLAKHRLLHHITAAASSAGDMDTALATTVQSLRAALSGDQVAIYFLEGEDRLVLHASAGYDEDSRTQESIKVGEGIVGAAALDRRPIRLNDIRTDPRYIPVDPRTASELAVPILFNEQLLGILNIESYKIAAYDENDQEILATLGNNLASIIANTKLVEQVRVQVERQQKLYEITSKIRRSTDLRVILETSAAEIGKLLHANSVRVQVNPEQTNGNHQEGEA